ncbi:MAG: hypothetical protein AAB652_00060 [Patescibacteria group bacterium]|mgnify:CR=1 FL=1
MRIRFFLWGLISIVTLGVFAIEILPTIKEPPPLIIEEAAANTLAPVTITHASTTQEQGSVEIEKVTVEMVSPYLDATIKMRTGLEMWSCPDTNFDKLPGRNIHRDPVLEALATNTVFLFWNNQRGDRMSNYIPLEELDDHLRKFTIGDSPWGLFADPRLQKGISPYLEEVKAGVIAYREKEIAIKKTEAHPPSPS